LDFDITYRFEADEIPVIGGDYGSFSVGLNGTWVDTYEFVLTGLPDEVCPGSTKRPPCEGVGKRNDRTSVVPPIPEWRMNARLNWGYGNHNATLTARYIDEIEEDSVFRAANPKFINDITTFDLQYTYAIDGLFGGDRATKVTVGGINIFDRLIPGMLTLGGLETFLHDPRGAMWYVRFNQDV
jgi:hypothetical protein